MVQGLAPGFSLCTACFQVNQVLLLGKVSLLNTNLPRKGSMVSFTCLLQSIFNLELC